MIQAEYNALQDAIEYLAIAETSTRSRAAIEAIQCAIEHIHKACVEYIARREDIARRTGAC